MKPQLRPTNCYHINQVLSLKCRGGAVTRNWSLVIYPGYNHSIVVSCCHNEWFRKLVWYIKHHSVIYWILMINQGYILLDTAWKKWSPIFYLLSFGSAQYFVGLLGQHNILWALWASNKYVSDPWDQLDISCRQRLQIIYWHLRPQLYDISFFDLLVSRDWAI